MRLIILALLLTSCAWMRPEPKIITKEVKVPVAVPCVKEDQVPEKVERETNKLTRADTIHRKTQALLIDNNALSAENLSLWAILDACLAD